MGIVTFTFCGFSSDGFWSGFGPGCAYGCCRRGRLVPSGDSGTLPLGGISVHRTVGVAGCPPVIVMRRQNTAGLFFCPSVCIKYIIQKGEMKWCFQRLGLRGMANR